jgi:hypothetical protein
MLIRNELRLDPVIGDIEFAGSLLRRRLLRARGCRKGHQDGKKRKHLGKDGPGYLHILSALIGR